MMPDTRGIVLIARERQRQIDEEGYTAKHDDQHTDSELVEAALCYLLAEQRGRLPVWPWGLSDYKPSVSDPIRNLVKAGALIAAEIDRLQRLADATSTT